MTYCGNIQCSEYGNCNLQFDCPLFKPTSEKPRPKANKYKAKKCVIDGIKFDSKREAKRYAELLLMSRSGQISELKRQVKFELLPPQKDEKGKSLERAVTYVADFVYQDKNGETIVEDSKGAKTKDYIIKRKMLLYFYGLRIKEV